ncbi:MAG TPA: lipase maturation factor family protein, partial [Terriglobia bacterium]|nr:lipase maturation factor family protein [Terriglobia bacterium]
VLALLVILGIATGPSLAAAWVFYLSLVTVGGDFMSFQWDILLLEAGFLGIFFAPWTWLEPPWRPPRVSPPSRTVLWLLRWLLFRLLFLSGTVKLQSGDPTWRHLTALEYHYYTQPLPTPIAWYMNQLPGWFQELSVVLVFAVEIGVPFLIFFPRRLRLTGAALMALLQILIALTGNYTFFNLLALVLCLLLLDDAFVARFLPRRLAERIAGEASERPRRSGAACLAVAVLAVVILTASGAELAGRFLSPRAAPRPARHLLAWLEPFHLVNGYGLFAVMTTSRLEIIVQGSNDGVTWQDYEFKYKPGDVKRPPPWVAPNQPRLDWQMWFAALGRFQENPWFVNFMARLLEGSPDVLALLERNPFPTAPPRYVRALVYDYHFTDFAERRATGAWWHRELKAMYFPEVSLNDLR